MTHDGIKLAEEGFTAYVINNTRIASSQYRSNPSIDAAEIRWH